MQHGLMRLTETAMRRDLKSSPRYTFAQLSGTNP